MLRPGVYGSRRRARLKLRDGNAGVVEVVHLVSHRNQQIGVSFPQAQFYILDVVPIGVICVFYNYQKCKERMPVCKKSPAVRICGARLSIFKIAPMPRRTRNARDADRRTRGRTHPGFYRAVSPALCLHGSVRIAGHGVAARFFGTVERRVRLVDQGLIALRV